MPVTATPQDLPEPVTTSPQQPPAASRKRTAIALGGAAIMGALVLGVWLVPQFHAPPPQPPAETAAPVRPAAAAPPAATPRAATPRAATPAAPSLPASPPPTATVAVPASPESVASTRPDSGIPWLDGAVTPDCVPAPMPEAPASVQDQATALQEYAQGQRLLVQGKLAASLAAFCKAARLNPLHSGIAFEAARAALIARDGLTASRFAERALAVAPTDRRSKELLADALAWQGDVEGARAAWVAIHKVSATEKTFANLALGAALEARTAAKQGDYAQAERFLRRALAFGPDNAATTTQLARVLFMAGHHEAARRWIQRALTLDATDPDRHELAGEIHEKLGDRAAASGCYERALELEPNHPLAKLRSRALQP